MQCKADKDAAAEEELLKREEARRLKHEKAIQDKAAIEKARQKTLDATRLCMEENARVEAAIMATALAMARVGTLTPSLRRADAMARIGTWWLVLGCMAWS